MAKGHDSTEGKLGFEGFGFAALEELSTSEGRQELFSHSYSMTKVAMLGELFQQDAWEDYEAITPNLDRKEVRRVGRHIGFNAAWKLLAPLVNAETERANRAEAKLDELQQYRQMLLDAGDGQWDPELVAADLRHILLGPSSTAAAPKGKAFEGQDSEALSVASEEDVRQSLHGYRGDELSSTAPSSSVTSDLRAAAIEGAREQVEYDRERGIATAQWIKDLATVAQSPLAAPADGNGGRSTLGAEIAGSGLSTDAHAHGTSAELAEPEWEYGWRSLFESSGEEYAWLVCSSRDEAERLIEEYQAEEDEEHSQFPQFSRLVYSLWKRIKSNPGPWIRVE